jgi:signal transduction histidine kinase
MLDSEHLLDVLSEIPAGVPEACTVRGVLQQVVDAACTLLGTVDAAIWLADAASQTLQLSATHAASKRLPERLSYEQGLVGVIARNRETVVVTNGEWQQPDDPLTNTGFDSCVGAPLVWSGEVFGVLLVTDDSPWRTFSTPDVQIVELLAWQGAAVMAYDRRAGQAQHLNQALEIERERLFHVQVAIREMQEQPDIEANLFEVVEALQALGWRRVVLALFSQEGLVERLVTAGVPPEDEQRYRENVIPPGIWQQYQDENLEQYRLSGVYFVPDGDSAAAWRTGDLVFAPLHLGQGRTAGVIRLEDPLDGTRPDWEALRPLDILAGQTAYIVENANLLESASKSAEALAEQVEELSMIHRADRELSAHLDVDRVMRLTMDWALRRTGADVGLLMLMTDDKRGLVPSVTMGFLDRSLFPYHERNPLPVDQSIMGRAARTGQTQLTLNALDDQDAVPFVPDGRSFLSVPLSMRGEVLGVVTLAATQVQAFDAQHVSFLERLARRAAVALDNARLYRQTEQMADDMAVLYTASRTITSTLERDEILQRIAQAMAVALECSSAVIFDYRPEPKEFQVLAVYRLGTAQDSHEALPAVKETVSLATYPAFQTAVEEQHPIVVRAADPAISDLDRAHLLEDKIYAMVLTPLIAQGELIGLAAVVEGRRDRIFTPNEAFKAETLASQASVALRQSLLYSEVRELEKLKSEMIRMASHDLRNPLNNIMGYLELLAMSLDQAGVTPDQEQYLGNLRRNTQLMRSLLEDLLTLERIESERQDAWQPFDLGGLVVEVVEAQRSSADLKHQTLTLDRPPSVPLMFGSVTHIRQAIANLVSNAIKYTPDEGRVEVRLEHEGGRLKLSVTDTGYGIAPQRQERIFERFYRAREPGTEHIAGTGLGLSLVKTVIERHGGGVWFQSELGKGSTFGFWVPAVEKE